MAHSYDHDNMLVGSKNAGRTLSLSLALFYVTVWWRGIWSWSWECLYGVWARVALYLTLHPICMMDVSVCLSGRRWASIFIAWMPSQSPTCPFPSTLVASHLNHHHLVMIKISSSFPSFLFSDHFRLMNHKWATTYTHMLNMTIYSIGCPFHSIWRASHTKWWWCLGGSGEMLLRVNGWLWMLNEIDHHYPQGERGTKWGGLGVEGQIESTDGRVICGSVGKEKNDEWCCERHFK